MRKGSGKGYAIDLSGKQYGLWTVLRYDKTVREISFWLCRCECGNEKVVRGHALRQGKSKSCGCKSNQFRSVGITTHGMSGTPEYSSWQHMKDRCSKPNHQHAKYYYAKGIRVCERWNESFDAFIADMGLMPSPKCQIDRVDSNGNYEPGNCRWATSVQNGRNTSRNHKITSRGKTHCISEWSEILGIKASTIANRLWKGWSTESALWTPVRNQGSRAIET